MHTVCCSTGSSRSVHSIAAYHPARGESGTSSKQESTSQVAQSVCRRRHGMLDLHLRVRCGGRVASSPSRQRGTRRASRTKSSGAGVWITTARSQRGKQANLLGTWRRAAVPRKMLSHQRLVKGGKSPRRTSRCLPWLEGVFPHLFSPREPLHLPAPPLIPCKTSRLRIGTHKHHVTGRDD